MVERRYRKSLKSSDLPLDYLKMVNEVFATNFDAGLKEFAKFRESPRFETSGAIFPDEVVLSVTLATGDELAATTAHASVDFDPKASAPTIEDLLSTLVDVLGSIFEQLMDARFPDRIEALASESLAAFEDVPFDWTEVQTDRARVYVKLDKSNPRLDRMADEWLAKHDPNAVQQEKEEQTETEKLFVTGPSAKKKEQLH